MDAAILISMTNSLRGTGERTIDGVEVDEDLRVFSLAMPPAEPIERAQKAKAELFMAAVVAGRLADALQVAGVPFVFLADRAR